MKNTIILLSSALVLSLASCRAKKNQTTASGTSTTTAATNATTNTNTPTYNTATGSSPKSSVESENTTISTTSNSKSATESETSTVASPKNPKSTKGSTESESATLNNSNPKKSTEAGASTLPANGKNIKNGQNNTEVVQQPAVYQGVTDQSCAVEVSFGSYGSGIDGVAMGKVTELIEQKKVAYTSKTIGREGEKRLCMPLTELNAGSKKDFIEQLKKIAAAGQLVSLSIR